MWKGIVRVGAMLLTLSLLFALSLLFGAWGREGTLPPIQVCVPQGDVNFDGLVNQADMDKLGQIILGLDAPTIGADVNGDGMIDMGDVIAVELLISG